MKCGKCKGKSDKNEIGNHICDVLTTLDYSAKNENFFKTKGLMYGPWMSGLQIPIQAIKSLNSGETVYMVEDDGYTKMRSTRGQCRYYAGKISEFDPE